MPIAYNIMGETPQRRKDPTMRSRPLLALLLAAAVAAPALADDVYLVNGETFAGVVATEVGSQVRIRMPGGEMRLPRSLVLRVESAQTPYREYLRRKEALDAATGATAEDWLALAEWAQGKGLLHDAREAARLAAERAPELPGLAALMPSLGYVQDGEGGPWITREAAASRQRELEPPLLPPDPASIAWRRRDADARAAEREAAEARRLAEEAPVAPAAVPAPLVQVNVITPLIYAIPVPFVVRGGTFQPSPRPEPHGGPVLDLFERQPGSLIPGTLDLDSPRR
jgi:hypothetical protein